MQERLIKKMEGIKMNNRMKGILVSFAVVCALLIGQTAHAQDSPFAIENVPNIVGVGVAMHILPLWPTLAFAIVGFFGIMFGAKASAGAS